MKVIVYAQDLSGRRDDGFYSKPDLSAALDLFFSSEAESNFLDDTAEDLLTRQQAEDLFNTDGSICFYNLEGVT